MGLRWDYQTHPLDAPSPTADRGCVMADDPDDWHVMPLGDLREHTARRDCWCRPAEAEPGLWFHNSMDRREHTIEQGVTQ